MQPIWETQKPISLYMVFSLLGLCICCFRNLERCSQIEWHIGGEGGNYIPLGTHLLILGGLFCRIASGKAHF